MPTPFGTITEAEIRNGWNQRALDAYLAQRNEETGLVPGNVVTAFVRPRPPIRVENSRESKNGRGYRPDQWWRKRDAYQRGRP
jgi:hypothetical protein